MDDIYRYIIGWAIPTALTGALGYVIGLLRQAKDAKSASDAAILADRSTIRELTLMVCRMVIYDEHFSVDEKLDAFSLYRSKGGNSRTKHYMDDLLGEDVNDYLESLGRC